MFAMFLGDILGLNAQYDIGYINEWYFSL